MKLFLKITAACFLGVATAKHHEIQTDRDAAVLDFAATRVGGRTYVDSLDAQILESMDLFGVPSVTTTEITFTSEMQVTDLPEGGQKIHSTITDLSMSFAMESSLFSSTLECTSDEDASSQDAMCGDMFSVMDTAFDYLVDDQGQIANEDTAGGDFSQTDGDDISPSQAVLQTSRMMKLLTDVPVQPGDHWDVDTFLDADTGHLTGTSMLQGYTDYKGHDCAVVTTSGDLLLDMDKTIQLLGDEMAALLGDVKIRDATLVSTLYWDNADKIVRWSEASISMVMEMNSPIDGSTMEISVDELITATSNFKE